MDKAKIEVRGLTKRFDDLLVLNDISFDVRPGEFLSIVGPTGCGKTTLLNILSNWWQPSEGQICIDGKPMDPRVQNLAFVFQESSAFPWLTVEQNIQFGMKEKKFPAPLIAQRTEEIIKMLGLEDARNKYCHEISASMEQRVVIGRSFALHPDLLLMDEPFSALDPLVRQDMQFELLQIQRKLKKTVIFITHDIDEAVFLGDKIYVMSARPGKMIKRVNVYLPHKRTLDLKDSPEFIKIRKGINDLLYMANTEEDME